MDFILTYISEEMVYALGWTVLHSFWQASLIALIMAIVLQGLQHKSATLRHEIAGISIFLVFVAALCTFLYLYDSAVESAASIVISAQNDLLFISQASTGEWAIGSHGWAAYFNNHMPLIVGIWILGAVFFLLRLLGGYAYVQRLKHNHNYIMPDYWQEKLARLLDRTPIRKPVELLESALIKTPMIIGFFKPAILLPIGIANALNEEEVEAILAHELAHIYRNDYLLNIVYSFIELLFYYNPAVWWISANIRMERENCCDDIGVQLCGNSLTYARALVGIQEMHLSSPSFAMSFSGRKNQLLQRIKRILNQPQNKSDIMEKLTATCMLLFAVLIISVGAATPFEKNSELDNKWQNIAETADFALVAKAVFPDTIPVKKKKQKLIKNTDKQKIAITLEDGEVTELNIDGKDIPEAEIEDYSDLTDELINEMLLVPGPPPLPPPPPPAPAAPNSFDFKTPPAPPAPPKAPTFRSKKQKTIITTKDEKGQTVIKIESDDNEDPIEIIVNEEEQIVFVDGNKLESGDTAVIIDINAHNGIFGFYGSGDQNKLMTWPEGSFRVKGLAWPEDSDKNEFLHRYYFNEDEKEDFWAHSKDAPAIFELYRENLSDKEREKLMLKREKKMYKHEKLNKDRNRLLEDKMKAEALMHQNRFKHLNEDYAVARGHFKGFNNDVNGSITGQLLNDGLIESRDNYSFQISNKKFKVNGKRMSDELHEKYVKLYRELTGTKEGVNFNMQVRNN